jgi:hypothetical protein
MMKNFTSKNGFLMNTILEKWRKMAAYIIVPIEHNIKQAITAAVRAVEFKKYHVEDDQVVNSLLTDIFTRLFPHDPSLVHVEKVETVTIPVAPSPAPELPPSPKAEKVKKPRAKKEKEEVVAGAGAAAASGEVAPKKPRAKKEKPASQNLDKLNPSQKKALKKEDVEPKDFLEYVNGLTEEDYKAKTFEEHVQNFKKPKVVEEVDRECVEVQFNGKTYFVDTKTKEVYVEDGDVDRLVGHVGMQEFADMVVPA